VEKRPSLPTAVSLSARRSEARRTKCGRSGRSLSEEHRYSNALAGSRSGCAAPI
jgi:hypothetical protein